MPEINPDAGRPGLLASLARWAASAIVTLLWLTPALLLAKIYRKGSERLVRQWGRIQLRIFGIEILVTDRNGGRYQSPPYLFLHLNQTSLSESFVIHEILPPGFRALMNIEYALIPWVGWVLWAMGGIAIVRQWHRQSRLGMEKASRLLRSGRNLFMSIEGRRSPDGKLLPYKKGPAVLAIASQARIVPLFLYGARDVLPHGEWRIKPGRIEAVFCEILPTQGLTYEDRDALTSRLRGIADRETGSIPTA